MTTLADKAILSSADNRPPMLEKDIIHLLLQGTSLTKLERECKLYDAFDKFAYKKRESLHYGLIVPVFQKGDDPIDAINHIMSFLTAVVTSWYPPTNNQQRNSSNPRQQATSNNERVTVQPIQGRHTSLAAAKIALMANLSPYESDNLVE
nr:hypothetical protein [Tanacetum cinerariifolium]